MVQEMWARGRRCHVARCSLLVRGEARRGEAFGRLLLSPEQKQEPTEPENNNNLGQY